MQTLYYRLLVDYFIITYSIDKNSKLSVFKSLEGNINQKYDINTKHTIAWKRTDITTLNE